MREQPWKLLTPDIAYYPVRQCKVDASERERLLTPRAIYSRPVPYLASVHNEAS